MITRVYHRQFLSVGLTGPDFRLKYIVEPYIRIFQSEWIDRRAIPGLADWMDTAEPGDVFKYGGYAYLCTGVWYEDIGV